MFCKKYLIHTNIFYTITKFFLCNFHEFCISFYLKVYEQENMFSIYLNLDLQIADEWIRKRIRNFFYVFTILQRVLLA